MVQELRVGGMLPLTMLDYPGQLACVLFCQGCAWRCRYCHSPQLIRSRDAQEVPWPAVLEFLLRHQGLLDAVVFSGGEATLQTGLPAAMRQVRELGFRVGLHSAGVKPAAFKRALPLCDWVSFEVKALEEHTALVTGISDSGRANWKSLELLLASYVEYECRTTVHWQLTDCRQLRRLAERLASIGVEHFVVQQANSQQMLDPTLGASVCPAEAASLWPYLEQLFPRFTLRTA